MAISSESNPQDNLSLVKAPSVVLNCTTLELRVFWLASPPEMLSPSAWLSETELPVIGMIQLATFTRIPSW